MPALNNIDLQFLRQAHMSTNNQELEKVSSTVSLEQQYNSTL